MSAAVGNVQKPEEKGAVLRGRGMVIVIPTYNERDNLPVLIRRSRAAVPEAEILIVDDNSPDHTADVVKALQAEMPGIHLLSRPGKEGLGAAYKAGFAWALEHQYPLIGQMDADLSHSPEDLPRLLAALDGEGGSTGRVGPVDLAIGSRYVKGGGTEGWPWKRRVISRSANFYATTMMRLPLHDVTGAFKVWRRPALASLDLKALKASGYIFIVETTWRALRNGYKVREVPIIFREREQGVSKMGWGVAFEGLKQVLRFSMTRSR